jgi:aspartyl-tRNA(Asn)/glutamyl-tRNA(Gln) amidotransferase subunit B
MRSKETSDDYRYFPEPDLPPLHVERDWLTTIAAGMPELPAARRARYIAALGLRPYDAAVLVADPGAAGLFEATLAAGPELSPGSVANWVTGEYLRLRNAAGAVPVSVDPGELAALVTAVDGGSISRANGKEVLEAHVSTGTSVADIIAARGLTRISDAGLVGAAVDEVLAANPAAVADFQAGKVQAVGFLVGQVMKATRGQADAGLVQAAVRERLEGSQR